MCVDDKHACHALPIDTPLSQKPYPSGVRSRVLRLANKPGTISEYFPCLQGLAILGQGTYFVARLGLYTHELLVA